MKQNIRQAISDTVSGIEDRGGVNAVTILASKLKSNPAADYRETFVAGLIELLDELDLPDDKLWYQVQRLVVTFGRQDQNLAAKLHAILSDADNFAGSKGKYDVWKAFAVANGGLTPLDISSDEEDLRTKAPGLWLDLVLLAHANDAEDVLTGKILELVSGRNPLMSWERLRSKTTEIRKSYPDLRAFRKAIQQIAPQIYDKAQRLAFLKAMDERLGTSFAAGAIRPKTRLRVIEGGGQHRRWLNSKTIESGKKFASTEAQPRVVEAEMA